MYIINTKYKTAKCQLQIKRKKKSKCYDIFFYIYTIENAKNEGINEEELT